MFNEETPIIIISNNEKDYIRNNILNGVLNCINKKNLKILKQLTQSIKKILNFDFEKIWKDNFISTVIEFLDSNDQLKVYSGIVIFHQLSKIYQHEREERKKIFNSFFTVIHKKFITILSQCPNSNDPTQAQFIYKIFKIYPKSFQQTNTFPEFLKSVDEFDKLMSYIFFAVQTPIENVDKIEKSSIFWKIKRISYILFELVVNKHVLQKKENIKTEIDEYLYIKFIKKLIVTLKTIYVNIHENKKYIDDTCRFYIYKIMTIILNRRYQEQEIINIFQDNQDMVSQLINDSMMSEEEFYLFINDPKTYVFNNVEIDISFSTKRSAVFRFIYTLLQYKPKNEAKPINFHKFYSMFLDILTSNEIGLKAEVESLKLKNNIINNYNELHHNLVKESILYILQSINTLIFKHASNSVDKLIEMYVIQEFQSPVGFMRERACTFIEMLKGYTIKSDKLVIAVTKEICSILEKETLLPVRVMSALAAPTLLIYKKVRSLLKGNAKILLALYIKLMNELDLEEIVECLQEIIKYFKEEVRDYVEQLCDYLIRYFIRLNKKEEGNSSNENNNNDFDYLIIVKQIMQTIKEIIMLFVNDAEIFEKLQKYINVILLFCFSTESVSLLDNGIEILYVIVTGAHQIPKSLWNYYLRMIKTVVDEEVIAKMGDETRFFDLENINDVAKIIGHYIIKDPQTFCCGIAIENTDKTYLACTVEFACIVMQISEKNKNIGNLKNIVTVIGIILEKFRGTIDNYVVEILKLVGNSIMNKSNRSLSSNKYKALMCNLISFISIYNPILFSSIESTGIFSFWLGNLDKLNSKKEYQNNIIGLCSLLTIGDKISNDQFIKEVIHKIYALAEKDFKANPNDDKIKELLDEEEEEEFDDLNDKVDQLEDFYHETRDKIFLDIDDDDDLSDEEEEEGLITELSKQNEFLYIRDTFNSLSSNKREFMEKIKQLCENEIIGINNIIVNEIKMNSQLANNVKV